MGKNASACRSGLLSGRILRGATGPLWDGAVARGVPVTAPAAGVTTVNAVPVMFTIPEAMEVEEARWDGAVAHK